MSVGTVANIEPTRPHISPPAVTNLAASAVTLGIADSQIFASNADTITQTAQHWIADGVRAVRIGIPWANVETSPGNFNWVQADRVIEAATAANASIICAMTTSPLWAMKTGGIVPNGRPASVGRYADFAAAVANRYRGRISAYEIWNEPNGVLGYSPAPDPAGYTEMLQAAYPRIKAADPNAVVVGGVLGSGTTLGNLTINPVTFLTKMYVAGAGPYFDALSYHPYDYGRRFSAGMTTTDSPVDQLIRLRKLMILNGDAAKKIWATEFGIPTNRVSEATQAAYISDMISTWQELPYAGPLMIYTTRDINSASGFDEHRFGIYHSDWSPKPARQVVSNPPGTSAAYQQFSTVVDPGLGEVLSPVFPVSTAYAQHRTGSTLWSVGSQFVSSPLPVGELAVSRKVIPKSVFTNGYQDFSGSTPVRIWYTPATGAHWGGMPFANAWTAQLGSATSNETGFGLTRMNFEHGYITWTPFIGTKVFLTAP